MHVPLQSCHSDVATEGGSDVRLERCARNRLWNLDVFRAHREGRAAQ